MRYATRTRARLDIVEWIEEFYNRSAFIPRCLSAPAVAEIDPSRRRMSLDSQRNDNAVREFRTGPVRSSLLVTFGTSSNQTGPVLLTRSCTGLTRISLQQT